jgi:hypothetical protein
MTGLFREHRETHKAYQDSTEKKNAIGNEKQKLAGFGRNTEQAAVS